MQNTDPEQQKVVSMIAQDLMTLHQQQFQQYNQYIQYQQQAPVSPINNVVSYQSATYQQPSLTNFQYFQQPQQQYFYNNASSTTNSNTNSNQQFYSSAASSNYKTVEDQVVYGKNPIRGSDQSRQVTVNGVTGVVINDNETKNWVSKEGKRVEDYPYLNDPNPKVIRKKPEEKIHYKQEVEVKFLKPPRLPEPGPIIIRKEADIPSEPAPPVVIRKVPETVKTPEPIVIREKPPKKPELIPPKIITIPGQKLPPKRKLIVEVIPPNPVKPPKLIIEKWLPYERTKRKVIFLRENEKLDGLDLKNPYNKQEYTITQDYQFNGVRKVNTDEYEKKYGQTLKDQKEVNSYLYFNLPKFEESNQQGPSQQLPILEGDIQALAYVDLDKEGLGEYKKYFYENSVSNEQSSNNKNSVLNNIVISSNQSTNTRTNANVTTSSYRTLNDDDLARYYQELAKLQIENQSN
jgi:hypothetical protein